MTSVRCRADVLVALIASAVWAAEPPLTTARQVRDLPPDRAAGHLPVRLEATIFHVDRDTTVFLQDDTGATFLTTSKTPFTKGDPAWVPGARVRVEGTTYPGLYVGGVKPDRIDVIGTVPLPPPTRVTPDDLASGRWHYQWVEVEGIVLSTAAGAKPGTCVLRLGTGAGEVEVRVAADLPPGPSPVEARVAVRGLAAGAINDRRQLVRPFVAAQTFRDVAVLAPPDPDPFARPTVPVCKLMRYDPERAAGRRVKVAGVVTYHAPGTVLGLRDGDDAVSVESTQADPLEPGDVVEVLGFPRPGPFRAVLAHAAYRKVGTGPPPEVRAATPDEARKGVWDADLVRVEATVVEAYPGPDGDVVSLRAGDTRFPARCPPGAAADLRPGTVVAVTGICRTAATTEGGYSVRPAGFEVWPRSAADIAVLARPPWWTPGRLLAALGAAAAAGAAATAWGVALRRQVRRQTAVIRERLAREAVLEERQRIARDVHDTLEQELVGLGMQIDVAAASSPRGGREAAPLDAARQLVGRLHDEVRALVWDLRETAPAGLGDALRALADRTHGPVPVSVAAAGEAWPVPAVAVHNLTRLVQEAVTNALKHAKPTAVRVALTYTADRVRVAVADDGRGFVPDAVPAAGHFGLIGMRERAKKLGADLVVTSGAGGTTVEVTLPRPGGDHA